MPSIQELEQRLQGQHAQHKNTCNQYGTLIAVTRQYAWGEQHYNSGLQDMGSKLQGIDLRIRAAKEEIAFKKSKGMDTSSKEGFLMFLEGKRMKIINGGN